MGFTLFIGATSALFLKRLTVPPTSNAILLTRTKSGGDLAGTLIKALSRAWRTQQVSPCQPREVAAGAPAQGLQIRTTLQYRDSGGNDGAALNAAIRCWQ